MAVERGLYAQWKRLGVSPTKVRSQVDDHDQVDDHAQVEDHAQVDAPLPQHLNWCEVTKMLRRRKEFECIRRQRKNEN